jgi:hypothetical protein
MLNDNGVKTQRDKLMFHAALYAKMVGIENAIQSVEDDKALNRMKSKEAYSRAKSAIRANYERFSNTSDPIKELTSKIMAIEP